MAKLSDFIGGGDGSIPVWAGDTSSTANFTLDSTKQSVGSVANVNIPANGYIIVAYRNGYVNGATSGPYVADVIIRVDGVDYYAGGRLEQYGGGGSIQIGYAADYNYTRDWMMDNSASGYTGPNSNHIAFSIDRLGIAPGTQNY